MNVNKSESYSTISEAWHAPIPKARENFYIIQTIVTGISAKVVTGICAGWRTTAENGGLLLSGNGRVWIGLVTGVTLGLVLAEGARVLSYKIPRIMNTAKQYLYSKKEPAPPVNSLDEKRVRS